MFKVDEEKVFLRKAGYIDTPCALDGKKIADVHYEYVTYTPVPYRYIKKIDMRAFTERLVTLIDNIWICGTMGDQHYEYISEEKMQLMSGVAITAGGGKNDV